MAMAGTANQDIEPRRTRVVARAIRVLGFRI